MTQTISHSSQLPVILHCSNNQDQVQVANNYFGPVPAGSQTWFNQSGEGIGIDQIRQIITQLHYAGFGSNLQRIILLEAHQMTVPAQNALLKTLEETPHHSQLILITSRPNQLLPTIVSRCHLVNVSQSASQEKPSSNKDQSFSQIKSASASQIIQIGGWQKERPAAIKMLCQLLEEVHQLPASDQTIADTQLLLRGLSLLEENVNVRLTLEAVFFRIAGLSTASKNHSSVL